ncbi:MAG: tRNA preQ1(34) S-adenosylmethionine ribosyltransferase-isomerase QueA [Planctomycetota bacterium]|jgi:S-adenosylmethionine:tRNA ribosyltransferase-isomerase
MRLSDFDYNLPPGAIAQHAAEPRDASRLLVLPRAGGAAEHSIFRDIADRLRPGDLLVLNDTKVIPARLFGTRALTGGRVECLLVREHAGGAWEAMLRTRGKPQPGERLELGDGALRAELIERGEGGLWRLRLEAPGGDPSAVHKRLEEVGRMPLPPYIDRKSEAIDPAVHLVDRTRYQTVFADAPGAIAAPTAGLHFTERLLAALERHGVNLARLTLHVGPGTFRPVTTEDPREHRMHEEVYSMPLVTREAILRTREAGGRVIACGTTSVRTIETVAAGAPLAGATRLFLYPPMAPRWTDGLITNFHLPRSTLLMLVSIFVGRERLLAAYRDAIERGYRFYSYGDAMLCL